MFKFRNLSFSLLICATFTVITSAQNPPPVASQAQSSSADAKNKQSFVSVDGGFTIDLPQSVSGFSGVKTNAGVTGGSQFNWRVPEGMFYVGYVDRTSKPENAKEELQFAGSNLTQHHEANNGGKLLSQKEISLDGIPGIEVKMQLPVGAIGITRFYLVTDRMYILSASWAEKEDGTPQLKILDSFKLIDGKALLAKKIKDATPEDLPQSPIVKKLTSDIQEDGLKGKVKSVIEEEEDLTGTWSVSGLKMSTEDYYSENGDKLKRILYDYRGNPNSVLVYGFIDGMRVSKRGKSLDYEYNPPIMALPLTSEKTTKVVKPNPPKPVDTRYSVKYEYKYDANNRLSEITTYQNNGNLISRVIYTYEGNRVEEVTFDRNGKQTWKTVEAFNDKGHLIEKVFDNSNSKRPDTKYTYTYETFDSQGNWTKRIVNGKEGQFGGGFKDQHYVEYRKITYYP